MNWQEWQVYADNEDNWRNNGERGLLKAEYLRDFILRLWFEEELDVSIYELDFAPLFVEHNPGGVFAPLRNPARFRLVEGNYSLNWLNPETGAYDETAIDLAPECVRFFCERYGRQVKSAKSSLAALLLFKTKSRLSGSQKNDRNPYSYYRC